MRKQVQVKTTVKASPCGGVDNEVSQLHTTLSEPLV